MSEGIYSGAQRRKDIQTRISQIKVRPLQSLTPAPLSREWQISLNLGDRLSTKALLHTSASNAKFIVIVRALAKAGVITFQPLLNA